MPDKNNSNYLLLFVRLLPYYTHAVPKPQKVEAKAELVAVSGRHEARSQTWQQPNGCGGRTVVTGNYCAVTSRQRGSGSTLPLKGHFLTDTYRYGPSLHSGSTGSGLRPAHMSISSLMVLGYKVTGQVEDWRLCVQPHA